MSLKTPKSKYKKQILWYLLIASILPVLVLGVYSYYTYISGITKRVNVSTEASLRQVQISVDNIEESIRKNYLEIVESDEIKWLVDTDIRYSDYSELKQATGKITGPVYLSEYISQYTFINLETDWVLSNYGMAPFNEIINKDAFKEFFYKTNESGRIFWLNRIGDEKETYFDKRIFINTDNLSLILKLPLVREKYSSMLIVSIHKDNFESLMKNSIGNGNITVLDNNGKIIYTDSSNKVIGEFCEDNIEYIKTLSMAKEIRLEDKSSYNFMSTVSPVSGWTYVASYNMNLVNEGAVGILAVMAFLVIIVVIIVFIIKLGTRKIYEPVLELARHMGAATGGNNTQSDSDIHIEDEFGYLETRFDSLVDSKSNLENLVSKQREQLGELLVLRLIRGELTKSVIDQRVKMLGIELKENMCLIAAICRYQSENDDKENTQQDIVRIDVVASMPENIREKLIFPVIDNARALIMVVGNDDIDELDANVFEIHKLLSNFVVEKYNYVINSGISKNFNNLEKFHIAYREGIEALKNSAIYESSESEEIGSDHISFYSDIALSKEVNYTYEQILERRMKEAVDNCDEETAYELLDEFLESINGKGFTNNERYFSLHRMMIGIILVATTAGLFVDDIFGSSEYNIFLKFNQIYDAEKLRGFYKYKLISPIIERLIDFRKSNSEVIFEKIKKIITEVKGDITLAECADRMGYHPSYLWKVMKTKVDMSFTDYLALEKMRIAKEMLIETDLTVAKIASELNYTNTQNFIRFFSKHENITPGKYRKANREE
ncbi:MAG: helix-turn-helix transcriptional regulator [Clostridiales bacterium]|nr:helix-turn-helix transcriptional regulator [Clostridiales bacterium]